MNRRNMLKACATLLPSVTVLNACATATQTNPASPVAPPTSKEQTLATRFTKSLNVEHPFICAGMAFICDEVDLGIAVSQAGGVGALAGSLLSPDELRKKIRLIKAATDKPFHVNFLVLFPHDAQINVCIEEQVPIVSFHFGVPSTKTVASLQAANITVWNQIGSVEQARAANAVGVDGFIVQGNEAGGHNYDGMPLMALLPAVRDVIPIQKMVFAAGGIADGRTVAAALSMGADAVWVGTRMVATPEAHAHDNYKQRLVAAAGENTLISHVYGPEFPAFNPMRIIENATTDQWQNRVAELPADRSNLTSIGTTVFAGQKRDAKPFDSFIPVPATTGDFDQMPMLAGQGVGLITSIEPAAKVTLDMMVSAARLIEDLGTSTDGKS